MAIRSPGSAWKLIPSSVGFAVPGYWKVKASRGGDSGRAPSRLEGALSFCLHAPLGLYCFPLRLHCGYIASHWGYIASHCGYIAATLRLHCFPLRLHCGYIASHWGYIASHCGYVASHWGYIASHWGSIASHWGSIALHWSFVASHWSFAASHCSFPAFYWGLRLPTIACPHPMFPSRIAKSETCESHRKDCFCSCRTESEGRLLWACRTSSWLIAEIRPQVNGRMKR
jgi:hypothetical protein